MQWWVWWNYLGQDREQVVLMIFSRSCIGFGVMMEDTFKLREIFAPHEVRRRNDLIKFGRRLSEGRR
jgi:hypothetical protein